MNKSDRFWFGYLVTGEVGKDSLVVYDRNLNRGLTDSVLLYNLKRDEIVNYVADIVRPKLRGLNDVELLLVDYAKDQYFPALEIWNAKLESSETEEVREIKAGFAHEELSAIESARANRHKTPADIAWEYMESNDSGLRELGRGILVMNTNISLPPQPYHLRENTDDSE